MESFYHTQFSLKNPFTFLPRPTYKSHSTVKLDFTSRREKIIYNSFTGFPKIFVPSSSLPASSTLLFSPLARIARSFRESKIDGFISQLTFPRKDVASRKEKVGARESQRGREREAEKEEERKRERKKRERRGKNGLTFFLAPNVVHVASFKTDGVSPSELARPRREFTSLRVEGKSFLANWWKLG